MQVDVFYVAANDRLAVAGHGSFDAAWMNHSSYALFSGIEKFTAAKNSTKLFVTENSNYNSSQVWMFYEDPTGAVRLLQAAAYTMNSNTSNRWQDITTMVPGLEARLIAPFSILVPIVSNDFSAEAYVFSVRNAVIWQSFFDFAFMQAFPLDGRLQSALPCLGANLMIYT